MVVTVRRANVADARGIAEVHLRGWQIGYAEFFSAEYLDAMEVDQREVRWRDGALADESQTVLVAVEGDRILGFAGYGGNHDDLGTNVGEIYALYVDPGVWQRGIGTRLIQTAEAALAEAGFERAILWTLGPNLHTRAFYEHRDWRFDGATQEHRTGIELVRYAKELARRADRP